jgi:hypothetical protein
MASSRKFGFGNSKAAPIVLACAMLAPRHAAANPWHGEKVAAGDFDHSGGWDRDELAIAAPYDDWGGTATGSVSIFWRNPSNRSEWRVDWLDQQRLGGGLFTGASDGGLEDYDRFGESSAVGDFDHDGFKDLAIGAPFEDIEGVVDAGCVHVLYGASSGPNGMPFRQATVMLTRQSAYPQPISATLASDEFGFSLAAGDFDGNGFDDLAIGAPHAEVSGQQYAGAVFVFYSFGVGFSRSDEYTLVQGGIYSPSGSPQAQDQFGYALAAGNFNGDINGSDCCGTGPNGTKRIMDLAVSAIGENVPSASSTNNPGAGNVTIYYGRPWINFNTSNNWVIDQSALEQPEAIDNFGKALAAGDFNSNCTTGNPWTCVRADDLAIGVPNESLSSNLSNAGLVHVLYGTPSGLGTSHAQQWTSATANTSGSTPVQAYGFFGFSLATGDVIGMPNGGCQGQACNPAELLIGEVGRNAGANSAGEVYVLKGVQDTNGVLVADTSRPAFSPATSVDGGYFGWSLAVGFIGSYPNQDTGSAPAADLLIGAPGLDTATVIFGDGAVVSSSRQDFNWPW